MIRLTIYLALENFTWTESWWSNFTNFNDALNTLQPVLNARADMLGSSARILQVRLTNSNAPRQSLYVTNQFSYRYASNYYGPGAPVQAYSDRPYSCVMMKFTDAQGNNKRLYCSGIPDNLVEEGPGTVDGINTQFTPDWSVPFLAYCAALNAGGWGWLRRSYPNPLIPIAALITASGPNGELGIQTAAALNFQGGVYNVMIKGFRRVNTKLPGLGGVYKVDQTPPFPPPNTGPFIYYLKGVPASVAQNLSGQGYVGPQVMALSTVLPNTASSSPNSYEGATHHKRGGRVILPLGRLKPRV